jgi:hypothetical protein
MRKKALLPILLAYALLAASLPVRAQVVVSEMMSANRQTLRDEDGDTPDWVELRNAGPAPVNLEGWHLTDDSLETTKWPFPAITLPPGGYLVVFASGKNRREGSALHAGFRLGAGREGVWLYNPAGQSVSSLPARCIPADASFGQLATMEAGLSHFARPTPGGPNDAESRFTVSVARDTVRFSQPGGVYAEPVQLSLSAGLPGTRLHYTLDGTPPDDTSPVYEGPLLVASRAGAENDISEEDTSPLWLPPRGTVNKATVVRAVAYQDGCPVSPIVTHTYFVGPTFSGRYSFPLVSLSVDRGDFFSNTDGIYVAGKNPDGVANYYQNGGAWEREVHLEYFTDGQQRLSQTLGARIHGRGSRGNPQKSMRLYAKSSYGKDLITYPFFREVSIGSFKRLLLRSTDADFEGSLFRDELVHTLLRGLDLDLQAVQPVVVFINGEYWGLQHLRERPDKYYLASHYGISPDAVDLLGYDKDDYEVIEGDGQGYQDLLEYIRNNDISQPQHYGYVSTQMNVENYIEYQIAQLYLANFDWPFNNVRYWRPRGPGGKWRWLFFDCDACLNKFSSPELARYLPDTEPDEPSRFLLSHLLRNADFRNQFVSRFYYHLSTTFEPSRVLRTIAEFKAAYAPMVAEHVARWSRPASLDDWLESVEAMEGFAIQRPPEMLRQLQEFLPAPVLLYPNPAARQLYVRTPEALPVSLAFFNVKGSLVATYQVRGDGAAVDVSALPAGLYLVRVQYGKLFFTQKVNLLR